MEPAGPVRHGPKADRLSDGNRESIYDRRRDRRWKTKIDGHRPPRQAPKTTCPSRTKLHAGLLHFTIRQEPDERFIVEIDHLNAVAPRIAKIAPERRHQFQPI